MLQQRARGRLHMKRIIQVGVGSMGATWTDVVAASDRWHAAAYVDVNRKQLNMAAGRHKMPKTRCYRDLKKALNEVEADALLDVTPQQFRKEVCQAAFDKGLHVLSEKPLADSLRNAKAIVNHADKSKRIFMVAQNYRYQPGPQTVRRFIASGKLGDIGYAGINYHTGPHFGGYREEMAYPLLLDMSIHHFDLVRMIFNADVKAVQAKSVDAPWNWNQGDATVLAQLELTNGAAVNYFASWVSQGGWTCWNGDWRIVGSKGTLFWENDVAVRFSQKASNSRKVPLGKMKKTHQAHLLDAFADALDSGEEPETSGRRNLNSLAATYAAVKAARSGKRIMVRDLLK